MAQVLVLATISTKGDEDRFLLDKLVDAGVTADVIDISLENGG